LFKVEVSEGNVKKKFRNYAVKRATDDPTIIKQFMCKHNLKVQEFVNFNDYSFVLIYI